MQSLSAARENCTTAPSLRGVFPMPFSSPSSSDFQLVTHRVVVPSVLVAAQVALPNTARVSPVDVPSPASLTADAGKVPAASLAPKVQAFAVR